MSKDSATEGAVEVAIRHLKFTEEAQKGGVEQNQLHVFENVDQIWTFLEERRKSKGKTQLHPIDVLIDCAAVFRNLTVDSFGVPEVVKIWFQRERPLNPKLKGIVYVGLNDQPSIYVGPENFRVNIYTVDLTTTLENEYYYYYAQPYTVGTDIPQPIHLHGLCFIADYRRKSAVAQAIYRLRMLHHGHEIEFGALKNQILEIQKESETPVSSSLSLDSYWNYLQNQSIREDARTNERTSNSKYNASLQTRTRVQAKFLSMASIL